MSKCTCKNLDYGFCPVHKKFAFPLDIKKAYEEKGDWIVEGWASISGFVDLQDQVVTPEAIKLSEKDLEQYSTLLFNHDPNRPIGRILETKAEEKGLWIKARISKANPDTWQMIKDGTLSKFSIKGKATEIAERFDKLRNKVIQYIKRMFLTDASLVSVAAQGKAEAVAWYVAKALESLKGGNTSMDEKEIQFEELSKEELALLEKAEKGTLDDAGTAELEKARMARIRKLFPGVYPYQGQPFSHAYPYLPQPKDKGDSMLKEIMSKLNAILEAVGKLSKTAEPPKEPIEKQDPPKPEDKPKEDPPKPEDKPKEEPKPEEKPVEKQAEPKPGDKPKDEPKPGDKPKEEPKEGEEIKKSLEALNQKIEEIQKSSSPEKVQDAVKEFVKSLPDTGALKKSLIESKKNDTPKDSSLGGILSQVVES